ncbi:hypothetical protein PTSG_05116 [Salpingoeca rosetta]|uniref:Uncharacterized protein n=1 Tax=Salpingoeca rosetta (strain ATCC 50818 / BSB-021) TaxID=946362 RepID=F2UAK1_SALR5|nr:uncharacterized protein PTSG_05116 [Salpingoeca rosetta]EGD73417.1 hypothetical protein PTSG_05116 [Salpingoeca rosetta]|eukprot:XP_004993699.1 hypothetical protein PTSG_05116 [Salpingoeca rosetta]
MTDTRFRGFGRYPKPALAPLPVTGADNPQGVFDPTASANTATATSPNTAANTRTTVLQDTTAAPAARKGIAGSKNKWKAAETKDRASRFARVTKMLQDSMGRERKEKIRRKRLAMQMIGLRSFKADGSSPDEQKQHSDKPRDSADGTAPERGGSDSNKGGSSGDSKDSTTGEAVKPRVIMFSLPDNHRSASGRSSAPTSATNHRRHAARYRSTSGSAHSGGVRGSRPSSMPPVHAQAPKSLWKGGGAMGPSDREAEEAQLILDANVIFGICGLVDRTSDVAAVRLTDLDLVDARAHELAQFSQLQRVEAAENRLQLHHFAALPRLRVLELQSNHLRTLQPQPIGAFEHLQVLSLAHNRLKGDCISVLAAFPNLRSLDLSNNHISSFPVHVEKQQGSGEAAQQSYGGQGWEQC